MSRRKKLFWGVGCLIVLAVVVSVFLRSFSPGGSAVETGSGNGETPSSAATTPTPRVTVQPLPGGQPFIFINPGVVSQGNPVGVVGSNFDPGATIDFLVKQKESDPGKVVAYVQADKTGSFNGVTINLPDSQPFGDFIILARERGGGSRTAESMGILQNTTNASVKLSAITGRVGDTVVVTAKGFASREKINVYWNSMGTDPIATLQADAGGGIGQTPLHVPFGAPGNNTFFFEGVRSQTPVPALFVLLNRYPVVRPSSYSIRADNILSFSGKDFGPNELVVVYLGKPGGQPLATVQTDNKGSFANAAGFLIPFALKGKQTVYFVGSQSRAPTTLAFTVAPYMPEVEPSTYGGSAGTTISFYATGFARDEVVHIYTGADQNNPGKMVGCFQTDAKGSAGAVGSYMIPGDAQVGKMTFTLTGTKSGAVGTATITVSPPLAPVQIPPQAPFNCPLDGGGK